MEPGQSWAVSRYLDSLRGFMTLSRRFLLSAIATLPLVAGMPGLAHAAAEAARNFITQLGKETMDVLQRPDPLPQKAAKMEDILRRGLDFETIGKFVLGRYWTNASPQQREEFLKVFTDFVAKSYSRRLAEEASVNGFNITNLRDLGEGDYLVQTAITRPSSPPLNYEWRVRESNKGTKIVDVVVEGVSLLVTHRSDFTSVASQNGLDGLIASLRDKAAAVGR
jgi:phospholipid transport system substrate-binding protein